MASKDGVSVNVAKVYFVADRAGMDYVLKEPNGVTGRYMKQGGMRVAAAARAQAGFRTGLLKSSIHVTQERTAAGQTVSIGSSLPYALYHHEGTRPHIIHGRNGGMLRYTQTGRVVYSRAVVHPGTKPNKFLSDNIPLFFV